MPSRSISPVVHIKVRVKAGAKKESVKALSKERLEISVHEKAERNLANERVRELVALRFGVPKARVCIVKGHQSPSKIVSIGT